MSEQISYRIGEITLTFDNSDGITVVEGGSGNNKLILDLTNFTGKCVCVASLDDATTTFHDEVFNSSEEKKSSEDYPHDGSSNSVVTSAPIILREHNAGSNSTVKLLSASASVMDEDKKPSSSSAKLFASRNRSPGGKWQLETEKQYGTQLLQRERINFFNDAKGTIRPRQRHLMDHMNSKDDLSIGSAASSITTSINSAGSASLFSSSTKARKAAFQPLKAERDMCIHCCVCNAPFHKITRKRHNCRYCRDAVCTSDSLTDNNLPSPFKGVRLCKFCNVDVQNGKYRTLRRFITSLKYLEPLCSTFIQTEHERSRMTLTALTAELDAMLIRRTGSISISADVLIPAIGRHLFVRDSVMSMENPVKFRDCLYMGVRALATLLAITHNQGDFSYARAAHHAYNEGIKGGVNIPNSLVEILELDVATLTEECTAFRRRHHHMEVDEDEMILTIKAMTVAQEQAARILFYITHPKVMESFDVADHHSEHNNNDEQAVMRSMNASASVSCLEVQRNIHALSRVYDPNGNRHDTNFFKRFVAASIHNLLLENNRQERLSMRPNARAFLSDELDIKSMVACLSYLLGASEDNDARVHAVGALNQMLLLTSSPQYVTMEESTLVRLTIIGCLEFSFYSLADLVSSGDAVYVEVVLSFMASLVVPVSHASPSAMEAYHQAAVELANENSCLKAMVAIYDDKQAMIKPNLKRMIMGIFAALSYCLDKSTNEVLAEEGLRNLKTERVVDLAVKALMPPSSLMGQDSHNAHTREAAGFVLSTMLTKHPNLLAESERLHNVGLGPAGRGERPSQSSSVRWGSIEEANEDGGTKVSAIEDINNIPSETPFALHDLCRRNFFTYKQLDFILQSNPHMVAETDHDSGKFPIQLLAENKEFLISQNEELERIVIRLFKEYPKGLATEDTFSGKRTPFFAAIHDWSVSAQRFYDDNIAHQERNIKLVRFRNKNKVSNDESSVSTDGKKVVLPSIRMSAVVEYSLRCLSYIVDYMKYEDIPGNKCLPDFDVPQRLAKVPNFIKLLFFITDDHMRDRILGMSVVQRSLMYGDYLTETPWILELPPERLEVFVEKWLYFFDVARSKYRHALKDCEEALEIEEGKRAAVVKQLHDLIKNTATSKHAPRYFDIKRYKFLLYYLEFD